MVTRIEGLTRRGKRVPGALTGRSRAALAFLAALMLACTARAQDYPTRQIVLIVPFPAGGSTDAIARIVAEPLRAALGQPVVVQNITGAGATMGVTRAVQAPPDGHTLSVGNWTSHVGAGAVYPVPWHVIKDLEPVSMLSISTLIIAGRTGIPARDGKEFIAWLRANPGQATAATVGAGSGAHICGLYIQQKTGTDFRYVPYRGGAPVMADLMANQVDFFCGEASQMLPHFRAGKIKPLIVMSKARWRPLPDVLTMEEVGASETYIEFWNGMWAPKGTPRPIIAKLNEAVRKVLSDPAVVKRLGELGQDIPSRERMTPEGFGAFHQSEIDRWWPLIKSANIKVE